MTENGDTELGDQGDDALTRRVASLDKQVLGLTVALFGLTLCVFLLSHEIKKTRA